MNVEKNKAVVKIAGMVLALSCAMVSAASALTTSCNGVAATSSVTWTASTSGGVAPVAFLWGNGATTSMQTLAEVPGTYTLTLQATDASSSVATTTCSATVAPPATTTTTTGGTSIQDQIQALLAQIAALKAQIVQLLQQAVTQAPPPMASSTPQIACLKFDHDLSRGDTGDDVKELQEKLSEDDPGMMPPGLVTGFFGSHTEKALKHFQEKFGIGASTGFFGSRTRGFILGHCGLIKHEDEGENEHMMMGTSTASTSMMMWMHGDTHGKGKGHQDERGGEEHDN